MYLASTRVSRCRVPACTRQRDCSSHRAALHSLPAMVDAFLAKSWCPDRTAPFVRVLTFRSRGMPLANMAIDATGKPGPKSSCTLCEHVLAAHPLLTSSHDIASFQCPSATRSSARSDPSVKLCGLLLRKLQTQALQSAVTSNRCPLEVLACTDICCESN